MNRRSCMINTEWCLLNKLKPDGWSGTKLADSNWTQPTPDGLTPHVNRINNSLSSKTDSLTNQPLILPEVISSLVAQFTSAASMNNSFTEATRQSKDALPFSTSLHGNSCIISNRYF